MNPALTKTAISGWFGISYQAHHQMKLRHLQCALQDELVLSRVLEIRRELPKIGVRKLHHLLQDFLSNAWRRHGPRPPLRVAANA